MSSADPDAGAVPSRASGRGRTRSDNNGADGLPDGASKSRSRKGCMGCRKTRVKCDEVHPTCGRCTDRQIQCAWPVQGDRTHRNPRAVLSCDACRERKVRCDANDGAACSACVATLTTCTWTSRESRVRRDEGQTQSVPHPPQMQLQLQLAQGTGQGALESGLGTGSGAGPLGGEEPGAGISSVVDKDEVDPLLRLYFSTVHHFGYLSFIHEAEFWERHEKGLVPDELVLIMAANALRFGATPEHRDIPRAERWAQHVSARLLPVALLEFGATELMAFVLCQHYEFLAGRFSRGFVMAGMAARMMTFLRLNTLDEHPTPHTRPLLGAESLRRLAWAVWHLDSTIDGGNFGSSSLVDGSLTIKLPSEERHFLLRQDVPTEPLIPPSSPALGHPSPVLSLGAHLLRSMAARQLVARFQSRLRRGLASPSDASDVEARARALLDTLPRSMAYSRAQYTAFKEQRPALVHLHTMRNTVERHIAHLHVQVGHDVPGARAELVRGAREQSGIFKDALGWGAVLDPQMSMHAYNALEILLYHCDSGQYLEPLIQVIRLQAATSELVALVHPEAVNRMIRLGYVGELTNEDILAVLKKVHSLSNADATFDFQESFWRYELSLSRARGAAAAAAAEGPGVTAGVAEQPVSPNEALLEVHRARDPPTLAALAQGRTASDTGPGTNGTGNGGGDGGGNDALHSHGLGHDHDAADPLEMVQSMVAGWQLPLASQTPGHDLFYHGSSGALALPPNGAGQGPEPPSGGDGGSGGAFVPDPMAVPWMMVDGPLQALGPQLQALEWPTPGTAGSGGGMGSGVPGHGQVPLWFDYGGTL